MASYTLGQIEDGRVWTGVVALTAETALERFSDCLGMTLTLEGGGEPMFELAEHHGRGPHWVRFAIPVYQLMPAFLDQQ